MKEKEKIKTKGGRHKARAGAKIKLAREASAGAAKKASTCRQRGQGFRSRVTAQDIADQIPDEDHHCLHAAMLDAVGQAVITTDPHGEIIYINHAAELLYGWRADEVAGRSVVDVMVPQLSQEQAAVIMAELAQGRCWSGEFMVQRRDGTTFLAEVHDTPILDQDGNVIGLIGVSSDITSRKKHEASLRELNENLEVIVESRTQQLFRAKESADAANEALALSLHSLRQSEARYRAVVQGQTEVISRLRGDGVYIFASEVFCRFFGKTEADLVGKTWQPLVYPDDLERVAQEIGMLSPTRPVVTIENRVYAGDGTLHWMEFCNHGTFDTAGRLAEILSVGRNVSERKRLERAAYEQSKLAESFFNHSVSCLVVLDRNFNFLRVNEAYARACHRDISEFVGRNHFDMYPSDAKVIFEDVVRTREPFHTFERAFEFPDQPERGVTWWEWTLVPILDGQVEVQYLVFSLNEITERKRTQEVIEQSMLRVQSLSERVLKVQQEERDKIALELHDELGQTLTALKINLQMLEPHCADNESEEHLTEALRITTRALTQVRNMALDLRPLGLEELGLAVTLESHLTAQAKMAGWDSHFENALSVKLPPELKMACFRVAQEALTNVMRHAQAKQVWVTLGLNGSEMQLSVRDDGKGFDFAAASAAAAMASLGVIGMQERARQMGGRLAIQSAPGRGTEVRASFPVESAGDREPDANASTHT